MSQNVIGLLYIYTFAIASFYLFVQLTDLGFKNPLQLAHSGYQDTKIFGTKVWGGILDFNIPQHNTRDEYTHPTRTYTVSIDKLSPTRPHIT